MIKKPSRLNFADSAAAQRLFDEAFEHPRRRYTVQPADVAVAVAWLRENASMLDFTWTSPATAEEWDRLAMRCGDLMSWETVWMRNRCGWIPEHTDDPDDPGWLCDYPLGPDDVAEYNGKRACERWSCPVAEEAYKDDIRRKYPKLYRSDYRNWPADCPTEAWAILVKRPRYAYVPGVHVIGCEISIAHGNWVARHDDLGVERGG